MPLLDIVELALLVEVGEDGPADGFPQSRAPLTVVAASVLHVAHGCSPALTDISCRRPLNPEHAGGLGVPLPRDNRAVGDTHPETGE
jgi:hypothetical protein